MTAQDYRAPESIDRIRQRALVAAVIGLVICVIGIFKAPDRFSRPISWRSCSCWGFRSVLLAC